MAALRQRVHWLLQAEREALIVSPEESAAIVAERLGRHEPATAALVTERARQLTADVWVHDLAAVKGDGVASGMRVGLRGLGSYAGYHEIRFEALAWHGIAIDGDSARVSVDGRYHRRLNLIPDVQGPTAYVDPPSRYDLRLEREPDGWRLRQIEQTRSVGY